MRHRSEDIQSNSEVTARKSNEKLSLVLNQASRHEDVWGSGGIVPLLLTSALDGGERSGSCPGPFTPGERSPCTHFIGGWVGPRVRIKR
jgi:hypothetical protein